MNRLILSKVAQSSFRQSGKQWVKQTEKKFVRLNSTTASETTAETTASKPSKKMVTYMHPTAPLSSFNNALAMQLRTRGAPKRVLDNVLKIVAEIKKQNLRMDINTYSALLTAYSRAKEQNAMINVLKEMKENNVNPSVDSYNIVLETLGYAGNVGLQSKIKAEMLEKGIQLTPTVYFNLINGMCKADELEFALDTLDEMKKEKLPVNLSCYAVLIGTCLRLSDAPTALDLLEEAEQSNLAVESQPRVYMDVMRAGANADNAEVVNYCWDKAVGTYSLRPDEGTCLDVLRVAAKVGNTKLATDVIRQLSTSGYPYKEHYFTPLMEAFTVKKDLKSAFNVLDIMRVSGIPPSMRATLPIRKQLDRDVDSIDKAYYLLEEMKKENKTVDITAFNVVVAACADAKDLERTIATYREAQSLGVTPNVDTYNAVLEACIQTRMKGMGNVVVEEMKKAGINPNLETYSKMISLACTQKNYEDAFTYLEEMKSYDIVPPAHCYTNLANKLSYEKDPRFHMVLEEMETFGYRVTPKIRALWNSRSN